MGRLGVLCFWALLACDGPGSGETLELDSARVDVPGAVHHVRIAGTGATDSIAPSRVDAVPGDIVRFVVADRRAHALAFVADSLDPSARAFMESAAQLRGPPLVNEGAAWIVSLEDAPPGRYPFLCRSHDAGGLVVVTQEE